MSPSIEPFNEVRYNLLMDGLECSEILLSNIDLGDRIDAEYFSKSFLNIENCLEHLPTKRIGEIADTVASAFYPAATQLYSVGDTAFVRCVDCIDYPVISKDQDNCFEKIPRTFAEENKGISILRTNDIVITKVGTPCYASIINEYDEVALSRTVLGLTNIRDVNPFYLIVFLRSKYGFGQLYRHREQTIQYQLTLPRVKSVDVFIPSETFQNIIVKLTKKYHAVLHDSKLLYQNVDNVFLKKLKFDPSNMSSRGIFEKRLTDTFVLTGRLDAEYYLPKYDELFSLLNKLPTKLLGEIVSMMKSVEPGSECYGEEGVPFIRVSDFSPMGIDTPTIKIPKTIIPSIESLYPKKDTILFSKDGSVGIAYKLEHDMSAVTSGAILHLKIKNEKTILPDYLTLVLNSDIVRLQAERDVSGAIIQHWKPSDIAKVVIPILSYDEQKMISEKIQQSFQLRRKAEYLIEKAIKAVEIAIEKDENTAIEWLNELLT